MTGISYQPRSVLENLPAADGVGEWATLVPDAPERILAEVEREGKHVRLMAHLRLWLAVTIFLATLAVSTVLSASDKVWPATGTAGLGSVFVVVTLLTGRAPRLPTIRDAAPARTPAA